jgi:hypothetical protein
MEIEYPCDGGTHRLHVSAKGRVRLLDYDAAHNAQDVTSLLSGHQVSTCAEIIQFLRATPGEIRFWTTDYPFDSPFLQEVWEKRSARLHVKLQKQYRPTTKDFVLRALEQEVRACSISWDVFSEQALRHGGISERIIIAGGVPVFAHKFMQCRRALLGKKSTVLSQTMGVYFPEKHLLLLPCEIMRNGVVRLLQIHTLKLHAYASQVTCSGYRAMRARLLEEANGDRVPV